jgi:hypothetical protein
MSHYSLEELIEMWKREQLTAEQMIGQILQVLQTQEQRRREGAGPPASPGPAPAHRDHRNRKA